MKNFEKLCDNTAAIIAQIKDGEKAAEYIVCHTAIHILKRRARYIVDAPWNQDVPGLGVVRQTLRNLLDALNRAELNGSDGARFWLSECQHHTNRLKIGEISKTDWDEIAWPLAVTWTLIGFD